MSKRSQSGFTLIELLVTTFVLVILVVGVLTMFDFAAKMSRAQTQLANLQQAQRIAQHELVRTIRMAGRGGVVPAAALVVRNDRPADDLILVGGGAGVPRVAEHSDVVIVRGIFTGEVFQLDTNNPANFTYDEVAGNGTVTISDRSPSGVPQEIGQLEAIHDDGIPEAILVVSAVDDTDYAVVELDTLVDPVVVVDNSTIPPTRIVTLTFKATGGVNTGAYAALATSALSAPQMRSVAYAGVLEEYRFYVREVAEAVGVPGSPIAPELARARVYPGTEAAYRDDAANLGMTIADNILDLQASFGVDQNGDGIYGEGATEAERKDDDWGLNVAADNLPVGVPGFVRVTTIARSDRPDPKYEAADLSAIEDRSYTPDPDPERERVERLYRRWPLQSLIDLRNIG